MVKHISLHRETQDLHYSQWADSYGLQWVTVLSSQLKAIGFRYAAQNFTSGLCHIDCHPISSQLECSLPMEK